MVLILHKEAFCSYLFIVDWASYRKSSIFETFMHARVIGVETITIVSGYQVPIDEWSRGTGIVGRTSGEPLQV